MGVNTVIVTGRLGRDAEESESPSGQTRLKFSLAHSRKYTTKDGEKNEKTSWVPVSYYGKPADAIAKYLAKGKEVTVVGRLDTYEYEKDGEKKKGFEVIANEVWLGGSANSNGKSRSDDSDDDEEEERPSKSKAVSSRKSRSENDEKSPW